MTWKSKFFTRDDWRFGLIVLAAIVLMMLIAVGHCEAQFIGYTSAQSVISIPFNGVTCTAALAAGDVQVTNIGQAAHQLTLTSSSGLTALTYVLQGSYDGTTFFDISDIGTLETFANITGVTASQYYPVIAAKVLNCGPGAGTLSLKYSGISMTPGQNYGSNLLGQTVKNIENGAAVNTTIASTIRPPFANAAGSLQFSYLGAAGPSNSTLTIACSTGFTAQQFGPFTLATTNGLGQTFPIPPFPCPFATVTYTSGGATAATYELDYSFSVPGLTPLAYQPTHVTGTTATTVKATGGLLHTVSVNTGGAGTISIFDLATAACTGTPATNTLAVITATAATLQTFTYDMSTVNGICVKASVAMDFTVTAQ